MILALNLTTAKKKIIKFKKKEIVDKKNILHFSIIHKLVIYVFMFRMYPPTYNYVVSVVHTCIYLNTISTNTKKINIFYTKQCFFL